MKSIVLFVVMLAGPSSVPSQATAATPPPPAAITKTTDLSFTLADSCPAAGSFQVGLGDLDGDGDLDAVIANMEGPSTVWRNDGAGAFAAAGQVGTEEAGHGVAVGDLDGDGDLDVLLTRASTTLPSRVYFNDGAASFTAAYSLGDGARAGNCVALFDAEGDGDLDSGIYYSDRVSTLYLNDGAGRFAAGASVAGMAAWGDLDGDGDIDAIAQRYEGGYAVSLNDGAGAFVALGTVAAPTAYFPGAVALADLDGDGDLDLVGATVLRNDGAGHFAYDPADDFPADLFRVTIGDFDGNGRPDALLGLRDTPDLFVVNDGAGGLVASVFTLSGSGVGGISATGDLDLDGDIDLFVAKYIRTGPNEVWLNATAQVAAEPMDWGRVKASFR